MRNLFPTLLFVAISLFAIGQTNAVYILTEKFDGGGGYPATYDSVFVTTPAGVTNTYSIPPLISNPQGHDQQLSIIINGITSLGYKILSDENWSYPMFSNAYNPGFYLKVMFLGVP
jgi:hypothetical protein